MSTAESKSFGGMAFFDEGNYFMFAPDTRVIGATPRFRAHGVAQQMSDGTFDFVPERRRRANSRLLMKLAHGRVSRLKSGAVRLTLTVAGEETDRWAVIVAGESGLAELAVERAQKAGVTGKQEKTERKRK